MTILLTVQPSRSHVYAFLKLASDWRGRGHRVVFASLGGMGGFANVANVANIADVAEIVEPLGFGFQPLYETMGQSAGSLTTGGLWQRLRKAREACHPPERLLSVLEAQFEPFGRWLDAEPPALVLIDSRLTWWNVLVYARACQLGVPCAFLNPMPPPARDDGLPPLTSGLVPPRGTPGPGFRLRVWLAWARIGLWRARRAAVPRLLGIQPLFDLYETGGREAVGKLASRAGLPRERIRFDSSFSPVPATLELVLMDRELDFPRPVSASRLYLGTWIDFGRAEPEFPWQRLREGAPLIYCSLGTHSNLYRKVAVLYRSLLEVARTQPGWQLVLVDTSGAMAGVEEPPPNVVIVRWAPQHALLRRAAVAVVHGGHNSLKEALYLGVPLLVFPHVLPPFASDGPGNAARLLFHGLGLVGRRRDVRPQRLVRLLERLLTEEDRHERVRAVAERLRLADSPETVWRILEGLMGRSANGPSRREPCESRS